jgi:hypothetical protein
MIYDRKRISSSVYRIPGEKILMGILECKSIEKFCSLSGSLSGSRSGSMPSVSSVAKYFTSVYANVKRLHKFVLHMNMNRKYFHPILHSMSNIILNVIDIPRSLIAYPETLHRAGLYFDNINESDINIEDLLIKDKIY